jgi:hypothetical protein
VGVTSAAARLLLVRLVDLILGCVSVLKTFHGLSSDRTVGNISEPTGLNFGVLIVSKQSSCRVQRSTKKKRIHGNRGTPRVKKCKN